MWGVSKNIAYMWGLNCLTQPCTYGYNWGVGQQHSNSPAVPAEASQGKSAPSEPESKKQGAERSRR